MPQESQRQGLWAVPVFSGRDGAAPGTHPAPGYLRLGRNARCKWQVVGDHEQENDDAHSWHLSFSFSNLPFKYLSITKQLRGYKWYINLFFARTLFARSQC